jgi:hypothetical protein
MLIAVDVNSFVIHEFEKRNYGFNLVSFGEKGCYPNAFQVVVTKRRPVDALLFDYCIECFRLLSYNPRVPPFHAFQRIYVRELHSA